MHELNMVCPEWVAIIPYAYIRQGDSEVFYNDSKYQWWGETSKGIYRTIELAKEDGKKIMLKPQVWFVHDWIGNLPLQTESEMKVFKESYSEYILEYARLAQLMEIEMFCVGTELKSALNNHPELLNELIKEVRCVYDGSLTYAANWDNYMNIPIWNELDVIGINAYFPLSGRKTPEVEYLIQLWKDKSSELEKLSKRFDKKIWFTEYGYLSVDHAADKTWELESRIHELSINEVAQSNALDAFYQTWKNSKFIVGGFLWKWFPEGQGHEGYPEKDYTPQGKEAMLVLQAHFCEP
jgi:hypothetical protein